MRATVVAALLPFDHRLALVRAPVERVMRTAGKLVMRWLDARRTRED